MTIAKVRALIFVAVLFVTASIVVIMAIGRDTQTKVTHATSCAPGEFPPTTTCRNASRSP